MRIRKYHIKVGKLAGATSLGLLLLLGLALVLPFTPTVANATVECGPNEAPCTTALAETNIDLAVASTVSVALQSAVDLEVEPKAAGSFASNTATLTVATNNPSGYAVYMQAGTVTNGKASLVSNDLSSQATISPVEGTVSKNNFAANTWGYSLDGNNYQAVPAAAGKIKEVATTSYNDSYNLSFGVKVDTNLPAGQYTNSVLVSAVTNPIQVTSLSQLVYMQDMTHEICANTAENVTRQLVDNRDGRKYWVAKLKDGNCWMTQNLDLELGLVSGAAAAVATNGNKVVLTNQNTDISTANWSTAMASTTWAPTATSKAVPDKSEVDYDRTYSWDAGEVILTNPTESDDCGVTIKSGEKLSNLPAVCPRYFKAIVAGMLDNYNATATSSFDEATNTYDAHYLIGNYYSWGAATAGTGKQVTNDGDDAPGSICAKGWRMTKELEIYNLLKVVYGWNDDVKDFYQKPLYFVKGGTVVPSFNFLFANMGGRGSYWSIYKDDDSSATYIELENDYYGYYSDNFFYGYSVRCVAK